MESFTLKCSKTPAKINIPPSTSVREKKQHKGNKKKFFTQCLPHFLFSTIFLPSMLSASFLFSPIHSVINYNFTMLARPLSLLFYSLFLRSMCSSSPLPTPLRIKLKWEVMNEWMAGMTGPVSAGISGNRRWCTGNYDGFYWKQKRQLDECLIGFLLFGSLSFPHWCF